MKLTKFELFKLVLWSIIILFLILANVALRTYMPKANQEFPIIWAVIIPIFLIIDILVCLLIHKKFSLLFLIILLILSYLTKFIGAILSLAAILVEGADSRVTTLHVTVCILFLLAFILHLAIDIMSINKSSKINKVL